MDKLNEDRVRELNNFLNSGIINLPEARRMLAEMEGRVDDTDNKEYYAGKKPVPDKIAPSAAYHSSSDEQGRCPHCYVNGNQKYMGQLEVDSEKRPLYHCTSCNKVYAELPSAMKVIMKELKDAGHQKVGFEPAVAVSVDNSNHSPQDNYQSQQSNQKLDQVNSNLSMMSGNINTLNYTIQDLMEQVRTLAEQNSRMMEQLATDPLISIRKNVTEFNLK